MKIEVLVRQWAYDDEVLESGVHEIDDPSPDLIRHAANAESAGSIRVEASAAERKQMKDSIETDSASTKILEAAQKDGSWQVGNLGDYIAVRSALLAQHNDPDDELELTDDQVLNIELGIAQSQAILDKVDAGASYEDAVTETLKNG